MRRLNKEQRPRRRRRRPWFELLRSARALGTHAIHRVLTQLAVSCSSLAHDREKPPPAMPAAAAAAAAAAASYLGRSELGRRAVSCDVTERPRRKHAEISGHSVRRTGPQFNTSPTTARSLASAPDYQSMPPARAHHTLHCMDQHRLRNGPIPVQLLANNYNSTDQAVKSAACVWAIPYEMNFNRNQSINLHVLICGSPNTGIRNHTNTKSFSRLTKSLHHGFHFRLQ